MVRLLSFRLLLHVLADGLCVLENYLALVVGGWLAADVKIGIQQQTSNVLFHQDYNRAKDPKSAYIPYLRASCNNLLHIAYIR